MATVIFELPTKYLSQYLIFAGCDLHVSIPEIVDMPLLPLRVHMPATEIALAHMSYQLACTGGPAMSTLIEHSSFSNSKVSRRYTQGIGPR